MTGAPLLPSRSSCAPLAAALRRQDASDYDQGGRVEEYRGEGALPAARGPAPGPVACAHARGGPVRAPRRSGGDSAGDPRGARARPWAVWWLRARRQASARPWARRAPFPGILRERSSSPAPSYAALGSSDGVPGAATLVSIDPLPTAGQGTRLHLHLCAHPAPGHNLSVLQIPRAFSLAFESHHPCPDRSQLGQPRCLLPGT